MANIKEIQRTERIEFIVSKEEKELIWKFAESMKIKPSRLIRNIVLMEAESKMRFIFPFVRRVILCRIILFLY